MLRRAGARADAIRTVTCIGNLGMSLLNIGDVPAGLALQEEAAVMARRVFGETHPITQVTARNLAQDREGAAACPPGAHARGTLVGLGGRPELNGKKGHVVGFDNLKGRYHARIGGSALSDKPLGIKPANLMLVPRLEQWVGGTTMSFSSVVVVHSYRVQSGALLLRQRNILPMSFTLCGLRCQPRLDAGTAVIVEGVRSQSEWDGRRGLVQSVDAARGRYKLLVKGRKRPLGVSLACCRLESVVEQERQVQVASEVAAKRAGIEERVRVALAARKAEASGSEPKPEPEPEPSM